MLISNNPWYCRPDVNSALFNLIRVFPLVLRKRFQSIILPFGARSVVFYVVHPTQIQTRLFALTTSGYGLSMVTVAAMENPGLFQVFIEEGGRPAGCVNSGEWLKAIISVDDRA